MLDVEIPIQILNGNGVTREFTFDYSYDEAAEEYSSNILVFVKRNGAAQVQLTSDQFDLTATGTEGGVVKYPLETSGEDILTSNDVISIVRETDLDQILELVNSEAINNENLMAALDRIVRTLQEQQVSIDKSVKVSETSTTSPDELLAEIDESVATCVNSASAAAISATNAATSETNASTSETNAATSEANAAASEANAAASALAAEVAKIEWRGAWSAGTYQIHDAVENNGSSFIATAVTTEEPSESATDWDLLALKGTDGTGSGIVNSIVAGTGISVDNTDPTAPVVSADGKVATIVAGTGISVDDTDPNNPVVASNVTSELPKGYINGGVVSNSEITDEFVSMTSNTTPSGEECWATSQYSSSYAPWYAFNKTTASTDDAWVAGTTGTQILLRAMTSANPLNVLSITSRTNGEHPIDFTLVYTEDDMSGYSNVDTGLSSISFTTVRTLTSQSFTAGETKYYDLDSAVPVTATAYGIIVTSFSVACSIGRLDGYSGIYNGVTLTAFKARSSDDLIDFNLSATSLDITSASSWKSGVVPTLTSATIHIFADNNSGSQQFIFDVSSSLDSKLLPIPTNITDSYRYCFSIITNSIGNIIAFKCYEKSGGAIVIHYNNRITDYSSNAAYNGLISISVPNGVLVSPIINYAVESTNTNNCTLASSLNAGNSIRVAYQIGSGEGNVAAISEGLQTTTAQVRYYQYAVSGTTNIYNNGYTIER